LNDNTETNPDVILARQRLGRNQATLNIEIALANRQNPGGSSSSGGSSSVSGSISSSGQAISSGGSGSGGFGGCFAGTTLVRVPHSDRKPIFSIPVGTEVISPNKEGQLVPGFVLGKVAKYYNDWLRVAFEDSRYTEVRSTHPYCNENGIYVPIEEADHVMHFTDRGWKKVGIREKMPIKSITRRLFFNFEIEIYAAYTANDDWVSNRKPVESEA
jgi:hypothetical protein